MYSVHGRVSVDNMSEFDEHEDTMCEKNLCKNSKRTTGAEDTQNQHYQRVLAVVDTSSQTERVSLLSATTRSEDFWNHRFIETTTRHCTDVDPSIYPTARQ